MPSESQGLKSGPNGAKAAILRWAVALDHPTDSARLAAALSDDATAIAQLGGGNAHAHPYKGMPEITGWLARLPADFCWSVLGNPDPDPAEPAVWQVRFRLVHPDFANEGHWRFRLASNGRISWLHHQTDALPEDANTASTAAVPQEEPAA